MSTGLKLALPMRASASIGKVDLATHSLMWLRNRANELAAISRKVQQGLHVPHITWLQWQGIMRRIRGETGLIKQVESLGAEWRTIVQALRQHIPGPNTEFVQSVAEAAQELAKLKMAESSTRCAESWKSFVHSQLSNGAEIAHRVTKRDSLQTNAFSTVITDGEV